MRLHVTFGCWLYALLRFSLPCVCGLPRGYTYWLLVRGYAHRGCAYGCRITRLHWFHLRWIRLRGYAVLPPVYGLPLPTVTHIHYATYTGCIPRVWLRYTVYTPAFVYALRFTVLRLRLTRIAGLLRTRTFADALRVLRFSLLVYVYIAVLRLRLVCGYTRWLHRRTTQHTPHSSQRTHSSGSHTPRLLYTRFTIPLGSRIRVVTAYRLPTGYGLTHCHLRFFADTVRAVTFCGSRHHAHTGCVALRLHLLMRPVTAFTCCLPHTWFFTTVVRFCTPAVTYTRLLLFTFWLPPRLRLRLRTPCGCSAVLYHVPRFWFLHVLPFCCPRTHTRLLHATYTVLPHTHPAHCHVYATYGSFYLHGCCRLRSAGAGSLLRSRTVAFTAVYARLPGCLPFVYVAAALLRFTDYNGSGSRLVLPFLRARSVTLTPHHYAGSFVLLVAFYRLFCSCVPPRLFTTFAVWFVSSAVTTLVGFDSTVLRFVLHGYTRFTHTRFGYRTFSFTRTLHLRWLLRTLRLRCHVTRYLPVYTRLRYRALVILPLARTFTFTHLPALRFGYSPFVLPLRLPLCRLPVRFCGLPLRIPFTAYTRLRLVAARFWLVVHGCARLRTHVWVTPLCRICVFTGSRFLYRHVCLRLLPHCTFVLHAFTWILRLWLVVYCLLPVTLLLYRLRDTAAVHATGSFITRYTTCGSASACAVLHSAFYTRIYRYTVPVTVTPGSPLPLPWFTRLRWLRTFGPFAAPYWLRCARLHYHTLVGYGCYTFYRGSLYARLPHRSRLLHLHVHTTHLYARSPLRIGYTRSVVVTFIGSTTPPIRTTHGSGSVDYPTFPCRFWVLLDYTDTRLFCVTPVCGCVTVYFALPRSAARCGLVTTTFTSYAICVLLHVVGSQHTHGSFTARVVTTPHDLHTRCRSR